MPTRRHFLAFAASFTALLPPATVRARQPEQFTGIIPGVALGGYDAVAYHTLGRATRGNAAITATYGGVQWRFASDAHRAAFRADPTRYLPRFGGYCAWAVSQGYTASGDPEAWRIVDGRLYLNYDRSVQARWETDIPGHIRAGVANWPAVLDR
jgi:YHS domain-containing protein